MSADQYLAYERAATNKHELWAGEVFAMAGASFVHNQIVANASAALVNLLRGGACVVLSSDMKVHIPLHGGYVYPDLSVVCGTPVFVGDARDVISNPSVIIEVLSDSTERFDRGQKFAGYRSLASVTDYLLISQTPASVEHYTRGEDGTWVLRVLGAGERLRFVGVDGQLAVDEVYDKVELATEG